MRAICTRCGTCPIRYQSICGALTDDELSRLSVISRPRVVGAHQPIFRDGDEAEQCFNVISGVVKLVKTLADGEQHIVGLIYPPDFLGRPLGDRHTYTAEAATDVEICGFPRGAFEAVLEAQPKLERKILEFTVRELDLCREWTLLLGRKSSYQRVGSFLYMVARRTARSGYGYRHEGVVRFRLPFTRAEIADYLGLTLETVSRQFSRLKATHIIAMPASRDVVVPDMALLARAARIDAGGDGRYGAEPGRRPL
ncbi:MULTISPECIES: Crp/Fnr family transcriptional regulator [Rhodomicrobium]|uniref:Crp/Fnr family transcriptional regulator n=1 Tax=Rhodomicrobium TaxID=1068 RepID=UPI000B4BCEBB|nr:MULTISPECIES: Crp/Fnr family transcriptional regulator [Rhodomicrobium]